MDTKELLPKGVAYQSGDTCQQQAFRGLLIMFGAAIALVFAHRLPFGGPRVNPLHSTDVLANT